MGAVSLPLTDDVLLISEDEMDRELAISQEEYDSVGEVEFE